MAEGSTMAVYVNITVLMSDFGESNLARIKFPDKSS